MFLVLTAGLSTKSTSVDDMHGDNISNLHRVSRDRDKPKQKHKRTMIIDHPSFSSAYYFGPCCRRQTSDYFAL